MGLLVWRFGWMGWIYFGIFGFWVCYFWWVNIFVCLFVFLVILFDSL